MEERRAKRRAPAACGNCRTRKVRCNVVYLGSPCTNCKLDGIVCRVFQRKRRETRLYPPQLSLTLNELVAPGHNACPNYLSTGYAALATDASNTPYSFSFPISCSADIERTAKSVWYQASHFPSESSTMSAFMHGQLPFWIKSLPQHMTKSDIEYLQEKDVLSIPEFNFRNALLRAFIEYIHPYMPILELDDFVRNIEYVDGREGKISLLLFQAVMFAGTAFVDLSTLQIAGYPTRKAARESTYVKVKLLYNFDYERDTLVLIQSLLLMTYWYDSPSDHKEAWHWLGIATSFAQTLGLHRNPETLAVTIEKKRLRKRIWWSCLMRDQLVCLGMRRPARIKDKDHNVPMLTLEDFKISALNADECTILKHCAVIQNVNMQKDLAMMCIEMAKLCLYIGQMIISRDSRQKRPDGKIQSKTRDAELWIFNLKLTDWHQSIEARCRYAVPTLHGIQSGRSPVFVHQAVLHMVYYSAVLTLHRSRILSEAGNIYARKYQGPWTLSHAEIRGASKEISKICLSLQKFKLEGYLPSSAVTVLLLAITSHLFEIKAPCGAAHAETNHGFCVCMQVLSKLRDRYPAADYAVRFLEAALHKDRTEGWQDTADILRTKISVFPEEPTENQESRMRTSTPVFAEDQWVNLDEYSKFLNVDAPQNDMNMDERQTIVERSLQHAEVPGKVNQRLVNENLDEAWLLMAAKDFGMQDIWAG